MLKRLLSTALLLTLTAAIAHAAARVPQVAVSGTALATFFASQGQTIDVNNQQLDLQVLNVPALTNFEVRVFGPEVATTGFGAYNTAPVSPPLYLIAPGAATPGWYEVASFRSGPSRLVVNMFDQLNSVQGTNTYNGADATAFGFYDQGVTGPFYTQDSRNGGTARILAYNGTGARLGWTWFACETGAGPGGDYADFIALVNLSLAPVPVLRSDWGTLKRRFQ